MKLSHSYIQKMCSMIEIFYFIIVITEILKYHFTATNGHSECLRLLIGNAEPQNAVDIQDGNGQ